MNESAQREIVEIVGEEHVRPIPAREELHSADAPHRLLVRPGTVEETSRVVALAHRRRWRVLPHGAGTAPSFTQPDGGVELAMGLTRLDRVIEHTPENLVASVECGLAFGECQRILGRQRQRIPLDPPDSKTATVGGVLATNTFGPRRLHYGTARDWVIGITVVRFDGELVRSGGMVVKNVSGYDLSKLYIGSWGSLGILVRANFKLDPVPAAEGLLLLEMDDVDTAYRIVESVRDQPVTLSTAAVLRGGRGLVPQWREETRSAPAVQLLLGLEGIPGVLQEQADRVAESAARDGAASRGWATDDEALRLRRALGQVQSGREAALHLRLHYSPAAYTSVMQEVEAAEPPGSFSELSLLGSGVGWLSWPEAGSPDECARRVEQLRAICTRYHGWLAVERQPAECRGRIAPFRIPSPALEVMQRIKAALDPTGTFGAGPLAGAGAVDV